VSAGPDAPAEAPLADAQRAPRAETAPGGVPERAPDLADGPPDEELVARCRAGDPESFTPLVRRHQRMAFALAFGVLRDREEADEVTQEAFVTAFHRLHQFDGRAAFGTWLGRIVLNRSVDAWRRRRRWRFLLDGSAPRAGGEAALAALADPRPDPQAELERRQLADRFDRLLETLSPRQRVVFTLRHLQRRSTREAALLTGLDEGSVKTHLLRAVRKLRAGLERFR